MSEEVKAAMVIPSFNLNADALDITTDKELAEAIEKEGKKGFDVGNYTLRTSKARFHANKTTGLVTCAKDPTWFNVAVTLASADGRSKDHFIQVPTSKVKYGEKGTLFVYKKFCEFMASIGEAVTLNNLAKLALKYFSSEEALKKLNDKDVVVDFAYEGAYSEAVGDSFKIVLPKTGDYKEDDEVILFPDRASAKVFAASKGVELSFPQISKLHSAVKAVSTEGWD